MTSSSRPADPGPVRVAVPTEPGELSTGELLTRLTTQVTGLVRGELELAKTELAAKGKRAGVGAGLAGAGGLLALFGLGALVLAAIAALALVVSAWLAALVVGVVLLLVAGGLALAGRSSLKKAVPPTPERTVQSVQEDVATVKEAVRR